MSAVRSAIVLKRHQRAVPRDRPLISNIPCRLPHVDLGNAEPVEAAKRVRDRHRSARQRQRFNLVQIYLPIADLPVNIFLVLAMGIAVGFISGMFGIGGGFLMTPLLIFIGISPAVAVATVASHIAASSFSGAMSYWRRRAVDLALAVMLLPAASSAPRRASGCSRCCARSASST